MKRKHCIDAQSDESLTRQVPSDMLAQIRAEEKLLIEEERAAAEIDAIPRIARGSEHSVSANVVPRASSPVAAVEIPAVTVLPMAEVWEPPSQTLHAPPRRKQDLWLIILLLLGIGIIGVGICSSSNKDAGTESVE